jgi:hypothetical protein
MGRFFFNFFTHEVLLKNKERVFVLVNIYIIENYIVHNFFTLQCDYLCYKEINYTEYP